MRCLGCAKEISDDEKYCDECKIKMADREIEKEEKKEFKIINQKKRQKILVGVALFLVLCVASYKGLPLIKQKLENKKQQVVKEEGDTTKITQNEFQAIVDAYGAAATLAVNNYINSNNGYIPKFEDIKDDIVFERHNVKCDVSKVNYDGSLFLTNCLVDGQNINSNYKYGNELEEQPKSGDKLYIYKVSSVLNSNSSYYFITASQPDTSSQYATYDLLDTYQCKKSGCKGFEVSGKTNQVFISDGNYYLYNYVTKESKKLKIDNFQAEKSSVRLIESDTELVGLGLPDSKGKYAVYSLAADKVITAFSYYNVYTTNSMAKKGMFFAENENGTFVLKTIDAGFVKAIPDYHSISGGDNGLYEALPISVNYSTSEKIILNSEFEPIVKDKDVQAVVLNSDLSLTGKKEKKFALYDMSGNLVIQSSEFKRVVKAIKDYVIVIDNNDDLQIYNNKAEKLATLTNVGGNYTVHSTLSGWYSTKGKEGIYVVVENKDIPYGTNGSGNEYYYIPSTGEVGVIQTQGVGGYAKPVLYLYPKKKTTVKVSFEHNEFLTTTYPKFKNFWKVTANKNGDLYDSKGRYYYGLYWEEERNHEVDFSTGFYVTKDNAIDFLEEKLDKIGFTEREANEFIMYWLPILEKNGQSVVYFELTDEREQYNKINIEPKVDSLLRVAMHVKKVDHEVNIKEEKLTSFKRKGFTAVEWGGVIY